MRLKDAGVQEFGRSGFRVMAPDGLANFKWGWLLNLTSKSVAFLPLVPITAPWWKNGAATKRHESLDTMHNGVEVSIMGLGFLSLFYSIRTKVLS